MKRILPFTLISVALFLFTSLSGQEVAITERGDSVVLFSNGTWEYYVNYLMGKDEREEVRMNPSSFSKPQSSGRKINGLNNTYELWYNDKFWKRIPAGELNADADIALKYLKGDMYAMIIYEEVEIEIESLIQIAVDNAIGVAPDIKVAGKDYRVVNGKKMIWMRMDGTAQGLHMSYYSYYFSSENGTFQFHVFSGQKLIDKYLDDVQDLLNGFVVIE